jgi:hypothetical protein
VVKCRGCVVKCGVVWSSAGVCVVKCRGCVNHVLSYLWASGQVGGLLFINRCLL